MLPTTFDRQNNDSRIKNQDERIILVIRQMFGQMKDERRVSDAEQRAKMPSGFIISRQYIFFSIFPPFVRNSPRSYQLRRDIETTLTLRLQSRNKGLSSVVYKKSYSSRCST